MRSVQVSEEYVRTLETGECSLTPREKGVLSLVAQGQSNKEISSSLGISLYTVKVHMANIMFKLGATHRKEAVGIAWRQGQLPSLQDVPAA